MKSTHIYVSISYSRNFAVILTQTSPSQYLIEHVESLWIQSLTIEIGVHYI